MSQDLLFGPLAPWLGGSAEIGPPCDKHRRMYVCPEVTGATRASEAHAPDAGTYARTVRVLVDSNNIAERALTLLEALRKCDEYREALLKNFRTEVYEPDVTQPVAARLVEMMQRVPTAQFTAYQLSVHTAARMEAVRKALQRLRPQVRMVSYGRYCLADPDEPSEPNQAQMPLLAGECR